MISGKDRNVVDISSQDSFPASDPPAWNMGRDHESSNQNVLAKSADIENSTSATHTQAKAISHLNGEVIAIVATDGFDQTGFFESKEALEQEGAMTKVVSPKSGHITGWHHGKWGKQIAVEVDVKTADSDDYNGVLLSGGLINADQLRMDHDVIDFVRSFYIAGKPIAAACHATWVVTEIGPLYGHEVTCGPSLKTDIHNAGACLVDQPVVVNHGLITCRTAEDVPVFSQALIQELISQRKARINIGAVDV